MNEKILQYNEVNPEEWDQFVKDNRMGYAYHLYDVIALDRWINDKNMSFAIRDEDKKEMVMVYQLHIEKKDRDNENFYRLHSRCGFVVKDNLLKKEMRKLQTAYMLVTPRVF